MGWTSMHRDKGTTNEEFFLSNFDEGTVFHACGTVDGTFYAAVESPRSPGEVWAFVALTKWAPRSYYNFTYKDMTDSMGPSVACAPEAVLNALTPTESATATVWRERCRAHHEQRKALRGLKNGDVITLGYELRFTDGSTLSEFTVRRDAIRGGATRVALTHDGRTYRLPGWQDAVVSVTRDGEIIETPKGKRREEDAYAHRVTEAAWKHLYGEAGAAMRQQLVERYGSHDPSAVELAVRSEFREGRVWERFAASVAS